MRFLWLLGFVAFIAAIITPFFNIQLYAPLNIVGGTLFAVAGILSVIAANKDKEHLKYVELAKKDERLKNITILSKAKAFDIFTLIFPLALIFSALLKIIDRNSCIIFGIMCLIPIILQIYYFFKFLKKM